MGRCKACQHWMQDAVGIVDVGIGGTHGWGICELTINRWQGDETKRSRAVAIDHEGWFAALRTAPNFGCSQFAGRA